jgi:alkaline phosphatase D
MLEDANKEVVFCNQKAKGYILMTLTRETARADLIAVSTIFAKPYEAQTIATFEVSPGAARQPVRRLPA